LQRSSPPSQHRSASWTCSCRWCSRRRRHGRHEFGCRTAEMARRDALGTRRQNVHRERSSATPAFCAGSGAIRCSNLVAR
jgi:hypothetical protein